MFKYAIIPRFPTIIFDKKNAKLVRTVASTASTPSRTAKQDPSLVTIPSLPLVGSMVPAFSGLQMDMNDINGSFRKWSQEHGPFYKIGVPRLGNDWHGTAYVTNDPDQLMQVIRKEGSYPSGLSEKEWVILEWLQRKKYKCTGFYGRGPPWKRIRNFMQKDLLAPQSAKEYLPAMLRAAAKASPKASQWAEKGDIHRFLNFFSMDLFNAVLFGGRDEMAEDDYETFCVAAVDGLSQFVILSREPWTKIGFLLGFETPALKKCFADLDTVHDISQRRLKQVLQHIESGNVTDLDKGSYFYKSLQRMDASDLTLDEVLEIGVIMMMASVDTTSAKIAWNVLQLALNPDVQDRLRTEILLAVEREGGVMTPAVMEVPYLKAFVRETHRCTPVSPFTIVKELQSPTDIHGTELPAGSVVALEAQTHHFNPDFVEDPLTFSPERWLPNAVNARKNSPAAIIDHPFLSGPFSQGARRCPGSRVAYLEVQVALAQLLMDWNIHGPKMHWKDVPNTLGTLVVPVFPAGVGFSPRSSP